jgi:hypothetical protein
MPGGSEERVGNESSNESEESSQSGEVASIRLPEGCEESRRLALFRPGPGLTKQLWSETPDSIDRTCATTIYLYLNTKCDSLACLAATDFQAYTRDEICTNSTASDEAHEVTEACQDFERTFVNKLENSIRGGGLIPWWLSNPAKAFADFAEGLLSGIAELIGQFSTIIYGVPAPGTPTDPASWLSPSGDWWQGIQAAYGLIAFVSLLALIPPGMLAFDSSDVDRQRQSIRRVVRSVVLIAFGWLIFPLGYHGASVVAEVLAPAGDTFVQTPGTLSRFGSGIGVLLVGILLLGEAGIILLGIVLMFVQWSLAYLIAGLWPLFWALRGQSNFYLRSMGSIGLAMYFVLICLKVLQAALARILFNLPLGGADFLLTLFVTGVGLLVIFVYLPYALLHRMLPRVSVLRKGRRLERELPERKGVRDVARSVRGRMPSGVVSGAGGRRFGGWRAGGGRTGGGNGERGTRSALPAAEREALPEGEQRALPRGRVVSGPDGSAEGMERGGRSAAVERRSELRRTDEIDRETGGRNR